MVVPRRETWDTLQLVRGSHVHLPVDYKRLVDDTRTMKVKELEEDNDYVVVGVESLPF